MSDLPVLPPLPDHDLTWMARALDLASGAVGLSDPNPRVGCVIVAEDGTVLGQGHTQQAGGPHAEVMALRDAQARGHAVKGATAYVTLEPCSHHGRTPPCCDALVAAGVGRVVAALQDPNPQVAGRGMARLRAAGIDARLLDAASEPAQGARALNIGFFSRMVRAKPWVRLKTAASLDGKTALPDGTSQWITGEAARADGHRWRARAAALLTGAGTVLDDDPRLDVRGLTIARQPTLVVVDSRLQTPLDARLFAAERPVWFYAAAPEDARADALQARGAHLTRMADAQGKVDLAAMLADLARREINELHVEAGHKLAGSLLRAGLVDELLVYLAPKLIGEGLDMFHRPTPTSPLASLADAPAWVFHDVQRIGEDLRIVARPAGRDAF
ncbi:MAG: bifunctional diaminohydroxyphosphoribosylaminopyrimidine deaminase/5-amino-6-(5-phosphoribosylamino)uracil reductase RibD [Pseudacidovorax sp.]|uniref:bifunctional diaminohydroxyphosphoribosylaminopyrimidine deaminase/5-amino-6-(5-phosphoribosylamino)uracil reductase RibD n=1 Tax=Pseudacidovorax sp. TaxID=1934311 RepID=UPI001B636359|nr:bifunctional diaminohydroxyphosphoribosylaminopyrimidine deaminase/5-amino-6-(5-phosphoribosylamino)uracil reductase RibD [Pseudacidovorax sp.]MBP6894703.1 bifunctional diaminohydroxyphosphoribosylaminopyrimidine deaminase/5-amino-6-(5-phosphoribosylamino)uracil reductase RibD [Pseudacidovorax sp.]